MEKNPKCDRERSALRKAVGLRRRFGVILSPLGLDRRLYFLEVWNCTTIAGTLPFKTSFAIEQNFGFGISSCLSIFKKGPNEKKTCF